MITEIKTLLKKSVKHVFPEAEIADNEIIANFTSKKEFGDVSSNIALQLASKLNKKPQEIAGAIIKEISNTITQEKDTNIIFSKVEAHKSGFINFFIDYDKLTPAILSEIIKKDQGYGQTSVNKGKKWEVEHTSPNPNKAMHLGHLRNNVTGTAIANLWEQTGIKVIRELLENDRGIAISKLMWGYLNYARKDKNAEPTIVFWEKNPDKWQTPEEEKMQPEIFIDKLYVQGSGDYEDLEEVKKVVSQMTVDWENEDKPTRKLWKLLLEYSYIGHRGVFNRLKSKFDKTWYESDIYKLGKEFVEKGLKKGIFKKDQGAIITQLEKYKIPNTVVIKSDGTSLYITQDIALTFLKIKENSPDRLYWCVGPEQSLALKQLFAICEQFGMAKLDQLHHFAYGWMSIKGQGSMSSRKGNVVYIDELLDQAKIAISKAMKQDKMSDKQKDEILEKLAVSGIKFSILKVGRNTPTSFDFSSSLSFEGDSGPYVQYTYVRAKSVLEKNSGSKKQPTKIEAKEVRLSEIEREIVRLLSILPEKIIEAANDLSPNILCDYLLDLSKAYNSFYTVSPILTAETQELKDLRIAITGATSIVIKNGLAILGIEVPDRM